MTAEASCCALYLKSKLHLYPNFLQTCWTGCAPPWTTAPGSCWTTLQPPRAGWTLLGKQPTWCATNPAFCVSFCHFAAAKGRLDAAGEAADLVRR